MKPRGPLMIEHRLIEKMIGIINNQIKSIEKKHLVDPLLIDTITDFIKMYADRTHHGKEEDILFEELQHKQISETNQKIVNDLIEEHKYARKLVSELVAAKQQYVEGNHDALSVIIERLNSLVSFYPGHIKKEDDVFFPDTEKYFTLDEQNDMLNKFWEFDRKMIHEKYQNVVEQTKQSLGMK